MQMMEDGMGRYIDEMMDALVNDDSSSFSEEGAKALVEHLLLYDDLYTVVSNFDRVALRCDYAEYDSAEEAADDLIACNGGSIRASLAEKWLNDNYEWERTPEGKVAVGDTGVFANVIDAVEHLGWDVDVEADASYELNDRTTTIDLEGGGIIVQVW